MAFSFKQAGLFGAAVKAAKEAKTAGAWLFNKGGRVVGTPKGQYAIRRAAGKIYKVYKKEGMANVLKKGPKIAGSTAMETFLKKPKLNFERRYAQYVKDFHTRHGKDPANWPDAVKLQSMKEWAVGKTPGVHYAGDFPKFEKMGDKFLGQRVTRHIWRKVAAGSALIGAGVAAAGFASDKGKVEGYAEGPKGIRVEGYSKTLRATNPAGRGGHIASGLTIRGPRGITASGGYNVGIGHAEKAGVAHQAGGHLHISTPWFKTGIKGEEQHAFGLKSRSRRVAAIRRATFGQEQHLGVSKKMSKSQRAKDSLY